jgi:hypothetical protein
LDGDGECLDVKLGRGNVAAAAVAADDGHSLVTDVQSTSLEGLGSGGCRGNDGKYRCGYLHCSDVLLSVLKERGCSAKYVVAAAGNAWYEVGDRIFC